LWLVIVMAQEGVLVGVAQRKPRLIATAIDTEVEGVEGRHGASINRLGAPRTQIAFRTAQQLGADATLAMRRSDRDRAYDAVGFAQPGLRFVRAKPRVGEPHEQ